MKQYAVGIAVLNEKGEAVITRFVPDHNDLYSLPEAARLMKRWGDLLSEAIEAEENK